MPNSRTLPTLLAIPLLLHACASPTPARRADTSLSPEEQQTLVNREQHNDTRVLSVESPADRRLLEQPSRPVPPAAPWLNRLIAQMERTVRERQGAGLAAVQVGIPVRVALLARRDGNRSGMARFQAFVNPEITRQSSRLITSWEHCLSVPWGYRPTERPAEITVRYQTPTGETRAETLRDDEAVVFQQEMDHLNGRLLNSGRSRSWFIPQDEMDAFMRPLLKACRDKTTAECDALMKAAWEKRAGRP
jgi:peptide deformylase